MERGYNNVKQRTIPFFLLFVSTLSLLMPHPLLAEDLFTISLDELMQIEITGSTLTPKSLRTVPSAVTIFTHQEIKRMGLDSLDELMNLVPGFQSYRTSISSLH